MRNRLVLHNILASILGNKNLYYQQPENFKLNYPCVIYNQDVGKVVKADNKLYAYTKKYTITFMYPSENDSVIQKMLTKFECCSLDTIFVNDNLYHYVFTLYY